jgi:hypothetical protein
MLGVATIGSLAQRIISGFAGPLLGYLGKKEDVKLDGFRNATGFDLDAYKAALDAQIESSRIRATANSWIGARRITMVAGLPAAVHFGAVMLDSTFQFGWAVPKVPAPYDSYEWAIVQSFFIVAPAMPLVSATAAWLSRKR